MHAREMYAHKTHAYEMRARDMHARKVHAHGIPAHHCFRGSLTQTVVALSRSEFQNTSFCASCGMVPILRRSQRKIRQPLASYFQIPGASETSAIALSRRWYSAFLRRLTCSRKPAGTQSSETFESEVIDSDLCRIASSLSFRNLKSN